MSSFRQQFTGINEVTGYVELDLATLPAGWTNLATVAAPPPGTSGIILSCSGAWAWCLSPAAVGLTPGLLGLPVAADQYRALVGRDNVDQLMVQGTGILRIQYTQGSVGPMPILPASAGGGGGGGTVMSVTGPWIDNTDPANPVQFTNWENVIWVTKAGNNSTGQRNRIDLPFLDITVAEAAAVAGDVIMVGPGIYAEDNLGSTGTPVTFYGINAVLQPPGNGETAFIGSDLNIRGQWRINIGPDDVHAVKGNGYVEAEVFSESPQSAVFAENGHLRFIGNITNDVGNGFSVDAGSSALIRGSITATSGTALFMADSSSPVSFYGNAIGSAGVFFDGIGELVMYGNITSDQIGIAGGVNHRSTIHGNVISTGSIGADCQGGQMLIYGTVTSNADNAALCQAGLQEIHGDCIGTATGAAARCTGGRQEVYGNAIGEATGFSTGAVCSAGTQVIHGNAEARSTSGTIGVPGARCFGSGNQTIMGNVLSANSRGFDAEDGDATVYGEIIGNSTFGTARAGVVVQDGNLWIGKGARNAVGNPPAILFQGGGLTGVVTLSGGCYLGRVGGIGANAIQGTSGTVRNYGGFSSNAIAGTITVVGPAITVLP